MIKAASKDLLPGTRMKHRDGAIATLTRRKSPEERDFKPGWWCEEGGGLADTVIDADDGMWEVLEIPKRDGRYHVPAVNWSTHPTWVRELDQVPELVEAFESAMARAGLPKNQGRTAAIICAAIFVPAKEGYLLRPFGAWPPITP